MERNIALVLEYDGTRYSGWQIQENAVTIQGCVEKALHTLTGEDISVNGCSRTDAGVHAAGYVLNFATAATIPADKCALAVNAFLPEDITALSSYEVAADFHARFCAKRKTYRYLFYPASRPSALLSKRAWHIRSVDFDPEDEVLWQSAAGKMNA
ncbi:MAG: tRNA pseudouridine(38-40) synthase TruA, partial [Clostridia bacterium]|nr:tRNA pseudouridine(38-40) synthase TruA [Clostridia bacterium]